MLYPSEGWRMCLRITLVLKIDPGLLRTTQHPPKLPKGSRWSRAVFPVKLQFESWQIYASTKKTHYNPMTRYLAQVTHVGFKPRRLNTPKALAVKFTYKFLTSSRITDITVYLYNSYINLQLPCSSFPIFFFSRKQVQLKFSLRIC